MSDTGEQRLQRLLYASDQSAWSTVALALSLGGTGFDELRRCADEVLRVLDVLDDVGHVDRLAFAGQAASPLLQTAALLSGNAQSWSAQSDETLLAQGRMSAQSAPLFARFVFPGLTGLAEAMARPGARMLDVGTGVGALAVGYAEFFPGLTVVGLDVLPRVLALAAGVVHASPAADRVVLREQDVSTLDEPDTYALA